MIWLDVTNDVYKTDKMVFRRIPAAGKSYMMQTNNTSVNGGDGIKAEKSGRGRYLRVSYRSTTSSTTYLDEVLVWGEGEVSKAYPENIQPIPRGDVLRVPEAPKGAVSWIPLQDPTAKSKEQFGQPMVSFAPDADAGGQIIMARNETETRYFAVANGR